MAAEQRAFTRTQRLSRASEYACVFGGAARSSDRFFTVLAKINGLGHARLGLAISRRAASRAIDRSRLKRLARESFRQLELAPLDYVVMAKRDAVSAENAMLKTSLDAHFGRLSRRHADLGHG